MNLSSLQCPEGSRKSRKRVGRGPGSGHGKTSCKGHKGQKARSGKKVKPGFEGGQMPLLRRLPKFGFTNIHRLSIAVLSTSDLENFQDGAVIDNNFLYENGFISKNVDKVKLLAGKSMTKKLTVKLFAFSKSAEQLVSKAGGTIERVG